MVRADKIHLDTYIWGFKTLQTQLDEKHSAGSLPNQWSAKQPPEVRKTISVSCLQGMQEGNCTQTHT